MLAFLIPCDNHVFGHKLSYRFHFKLGVLDAMTANPKVFARLFVGNYFANLHLVRLIALFHRYFCLHLYHFICMVIVEH